MNKNKESEILCDLLIDIFPRELIGIIIEFRAFSNFETFAEEVNLLYEKFQDEVLTTLDEITTHFFKTVKLPSDKERSTKEGTVNFIKNLFHAFCGKYGHFSALTDNKRFVMRIWGIDKFDMNHTCCNKLIEYIQSLNLQHLKTIFLSEYEYSTSVRIIVDVC